MHDPNIFFEDFEPGAEWTFGAYEVTAGEIVDYAEQFDPQPMHLDAKAARDSMLGGLAASGWHSCAMLMRMMCDAFMLDAASWGSPGIDSCKWLRPVRPGDVLTCKRTILEAKPSRSRPDMGVVQFRWEVSNQAGEKVLVMENPIMFGRRPATAEAAGS
ncbi:MAG: MaoC family dehydratase [Pseudomonadota bacterium]